MSSLHLRATLGARGVALELDVEEGETVAVLGPNGAGKSTLLQLVSGSVTPDDGVVLLGEDVLTDTSSKTFVPIHARGVATLAQDALLFPHMDARTNVAFAPRSTGANRARAKVVADRWLDAVGASHLAGRRPAQLSGGQAQRVAIARALAADPRLLLLDEPCAALDVETAPAVRRVLRTVLRESSRTALIVTHDLLDVVALADSVAVVEGGRVVERGSVAEVLTAPRSEFGARIAGINLLSGRAIDADDTTALRTDWGVTVHGSGQHAAGTPVVAVFSPAAVSVHPVAPHASPRNVFEVVVEEMEVQGSGIRVRSRPHPDGSPGIAADITPAAVSDLGLEPGRSVFFVVKSLEVALHPALPSRL
ncbi:molybdenum ABC transporter ATP-binding protein [Rhodococcus sp. 06-235-1A]|uniref:sulfate/molybdate ABC transporter ATP-binding protein n=1 Tax=Rhodococcus sp. 06-235-1A TaxID=2022508 RepID=UPI000B9C3CA1|nr:ATP-binding cassette domain-containing protein [Rhodococcus sp. 06-235-1A]OZD09274.1 molybdenum ABC transporter ATP-binding protein [Rhodococcus sp. 06-235-1A]